MKAHIVIAAQNAGWVIGKMGRRLAEALNAAGVPTTVSADPDPSADINHWMSFAFADGCPGTLNTMFITHPDDIFKVRLIRERLQSRIDLALCMSPHAMEELVGFGIPRERLWYVLPAMDRILQPRRICIGITTRLYDDGRKREDLLVRIARDMDLSPFHFRIFGAGWPQVIKALERAGATVDYDPGSADWQGDYERILEAIPLFDHYLYMGMDEGSLGTLDAVSAGVSTIVTAQGFHLSLPVPLTHAFVHEHELRRVFEALAARRREGGERLGAWTWQAYASEHRDIWDAMLRHRGAAVPRAELEQATAARGSTALPSVAGTIARRHWRFYFRSFKPGRLRGAVARLRWLQPLRRMIGR